MNSVAAALPEPVLTRSTWLLPFFLKIKAIFFWGGRFIDLQLMAELNRPKKIPFSSLRTQHRGLLRAIVASRRVVRDEK